MKILALDIAEYRTGWLYAEAGAVATPRIVKLRKPGEPREEAGERFRRWLDELLSDRQTDLICFEHHFHIGAAQGFTNGDTLEGQIAFQWIVRTVAGYRGIAVRAPYVATIRKNFLGVSTLAPKREHKRTAKEAAEDRKRMKDAIISRAQKLGYLPPNIFEDNMADAAALHNFASSFFAGKPAAFELFDSSVR